MNRVLRPGGLLLIAFHVGDETVRLDEWWGHPVSVNFLFFRPEDYFALVERVRAHGVDIPILPGIMPILNLRSVARMAELSGADIPAEVMARFDGVTEPADVRRVGVEIATELCQALLAGGAPGLHFYTLNRSTATRQIHAKLGALIG